MEVLDLREDSAAVPVVLVHALGADNQCFTQVICELNYPAVITVNLPGHGGAPVLNTDKPVTISDLYTRLLAELEQLEVGEFHLAGISIGGLLTWYAATQGDSRLLSATVLCSKPALLPAEMWRERAELVRSQGVGSLVEPTLQRWFTSEYYAENGENLQVTRASYAQCNPEGYAQCCEVLASTDLRSHPVLVPVFHLAAAQFDAGATPQELADAYAVVAKLDAQRGVAKTYELAEYVELAGDNQSAGQRFYSVIEGAAHMAAVEQPSQVAKLITRSIEATGR